MAASVKGASGGDSSKGLGEIVSKDGLSILVGKVEDVAAAASSSSAAHVPARVGALTTTARFGLNYVDAESRGDKDAATTAAVGTAVGLGTEAALKQIGEKAGLSKLVTKGGTRVVPGLGEALLAMDLAGYGADKLEATGWVERLEPKADDNWYIRGVKHGAQQELLKAIHTARALSLPAKWLDQVVGTITRKTMEAIHGVDAKFSTALDHAHEKVQAVEARVGGEMGALLQEHCPPETLSLLEADPEQEVSIVLTDGAREAIEAQVEDWLDQQGLAIEEVMKAAVTEINAMRPAEDLDARSKELRLQKISELHQDMNVIASAIGFVGQLTKNPKLIQASAAVKGVSQLVSGLSAVAVGGMSFGAVGAIVGGLSAIVGAFRGGGGNGVMKKLMKQLRQVAAQIGALHRDMRAHFSHVFNCLGVIHADMIENFIRMEERHDLMHRHLLQLGEQQYHFHEELRHAAGRMALESRQQARTLEEMLKESELTDIAKELTLIEKQVATGRASGPDEYSKSFFQASWAASHDAVRSNLTGGHHTIKIWADLAPLRERGVADMILGQSQAYEKALALTGVDTPSSGAALVNPRLWLRSVQVLRQLMQARPSALPPVTVADHLEQLDHVMEAGRKTVAFVEELPVTAAIDGALESLKDPKGPFKQIMGSIAEQKAAWYQKRLAEIPARMQKIRQADMQLIAGSYPMPKFNTLPNRSLLGSLGFSKGSTQPNNLYAMRQPRYIQTAKEQPFAGVKGKVMSYVGQRWDAAAIDPTVNFESGPAPVPLVRIARPRNGATFLPVPYLFDPKPGTALHTVMKAELMEVVNTTAEYALNLQPDRSRILDIDLVVSGAGCDSFRLPVARYTLRPDFAHSAYVEEEVLYYAFHGGTYGNKTDECTNTVAGRRKVAGRKMRTQSTLVYYTEQSYGQAIDYSKGTVAAAFPYKDFVVQSDPVISDAIQATVVRIGQVTEDEWQKAKAPLFTELKHQLAHHGPTLDGVSHFMQVTAAFGGDTISGIFDSMLPQAPWASSTGLRRSLKTMRDDASVDERAMAARTLGVFRVMLGYMSQVERRELPWVSQMKEELAALEELHEGYKPGQIPACSSSATIIAVDPNLGAGLEAYGRAKFHLLKGEDSAAFGCFYAAKKLLKRCTGDVLAGRKLKKIDRHIEDLKRK